MFPWKRRTGRGWRSRPLHPGGGGFGFERLSEFGEIYICIYIVRGKGDIRGCNVGVFGWLWG